MTNSVASSTGVAGHSGLDPMQTCATCHKHGTQTLRLGFTGPSEVSPGSISSFAIVLHSRDLKSAGLNLAVTDGKILNNPDELVLRQNELYHSQPLPASQSGIIRLEYTWHAPDKAGSYNFHAYAVAADGDLTPLGDKPAYAKFTLRVVDSDIPAVPPNARLRIPVTANIGKDVLFSAGKSDDSDGKIVRYDWKFGDGQSAQSARSSIRHSYTNPGTYTVELVVTDDTGQTDQVAALINIIAPDEPEASQKATSQAPSPKAHIQSPVAVLPGDKIRFDASQSRPVDKHTPLLTYEWNFGDGFTGQGESVTHTYTVPGIYHVSLAVRDAANRIESTSTVVTVSHVDVAVLHGMNSPKKIQLTRQHEVQHNIISLIASVPELHDGITRCGIAYLERNGASYQHQPICFTSPSPVGVSFEYPFSQADVPVINWTAYVVMDSGFRTQPKTDSSRIEIDAP